MARGSVLINLCLVRCAVCCEFGTQDSCKAIMDMITDYRLMTISDYEEAYDLWIECGNGLNDKDDSMKRIDPDYLK